MQTLAFEGPARDDTLCFETVNDFPRLTNLRTRREFFSKLRFKPPPAPDSLHENWLKGEGRFDFGVQIADGRFQICKFVGRFGETPFILTSDTDALQDECEFS
jgi:hypothetical protein